MEENGNFLHLSGVLTDNPVYGHEVFGEAMDFVVFRARDVTSRLLRNARLRRIPVYVDSVDSYDAANGLLRHGVSGLLGENITPLQQACSSYHGLPEPFSSPDDGDRSQA